MWYIYIVSSLFKNCIEKFLSDGGILLTFDPCVKKKQRSVGIESKIVSLHCTLNSFWNWNLSSPTSKAKIVAIVLKSQLLSGMPEHPTQVKVTDGLRLVLWWFWGLSSAFYLWLFQVFLCYSNIVLILTKITENRGLNWKPWVIASYMYELDNKSMIQGALKLISIMCI